MGASRRDDICGYIFVALVTILVNKAVSSNVTTSTRVICTDDKMQIELDKNAYSNLTSSSFHLRNSSCLGTVTGNTIKLTTALNECGTTSTQTKDTISYDNVVKAESIVSSNSNSNDTVTRHHALALPFNCTYSRRRYVRVSFKPRRRVDAKEGGFGNFTFLMDLYPDSSYSRAYTSGDYPISVQLNQKLYVKYQVSSNQADLHVFAERCLATPTTRESTVPNYVFLDNGCPQDQTIDYNYAPNREQNFSIESFRFIKDHPVVYLHCLLLVCHSSYSNSKCAVGCHSNTRRRRDVSRADMESKLYHLSSGPITLKKSTESAPDETTSPGVTVIALSSAVGVLLLGCLVLLVLLRRKKNQSNKTQADAEPTQLQAYDNPGVNKGEDGASKSNATVVALSSTVGILMAGFLALLLLLLLRRRKKRCNRNLSDSGSTQLEAYDNPGVNRGDHIDVKTLDQQNADADTAL